MKRRNHLKNFGWLTIVSLLLSGICVSDSYTREARIKDLVTVEGIRENALLGYGIVVGLNGTGDRRQTIFTTQMLANMLQKMGIQAPAAAIRVNNVAAVVVTSKLPAFARQGTQVDVTVSSIGDAKSLEGGTLLLTPLYGADGRVYVSAQGNLTSGGSSRGGPGDARQSGHLTVARIASGATVEAEIPTGIGTSHSVNLLLREYDFATVTAICEVINQTFGKGTAKPTDGRRIELQLPHQTSSIMEFLAKLENLLVPVQSRAKVTVNERTGTIVFGRDVRLAPMSILQGNLAIQVRDLGDATKGNTKDDKAMETDGRSSKDPERSIELANGAKIGELVDALRELGVPPREVLSILQTIKAAGGLDADLEML